MVRVLFVLASLSLLAPLAHAASPPTAEQRASIEAMIVRRVFPGVTADAPLACKWEQSTACVPGATQLSFMPAAPVPTLAACQGTTASLQACYLAAITRLQDALAAGDASILFEAAYRTKDVIARAKQPGVAAPAWLKVEGSQNLLYQFFAGQGMPLDQVGSCRTGTLDAKYACLGKLPRTIYRAALGALDAYNAKLVRNGRLAGARNRALAIFRSGVAPMTISMAARNAFDPTAGAGAAHVHQLGKYFFLRAHEGLVTGTNPDAELAHLNTIRGYKPATLATAPSAHTMVLAANRAGGRWSRTSRTLNIIDATLHDDAVELVNTTHWTRALLGTRGLTPQLVQGDRLVRAFESTAASANLDQLHDDGFWLTMDEIAASHALSQARTYPDSCGWISVEDVMGTVPQAFEESHWEWYWDEDCLDLVEDVCERVEMFGGDYDDCYAEQRPECHMQRLVDVIVWRDVEIKIGEDVGAESIRDGYRALMDSNDGDPYDTDGDGKPDLNYNSDTTATIANAGVWAGNATEGCLGELDALGSEYSTTFNVAGDGANTDGANGVDEDITDPFASASADWDFIPYPVAARTCPAFARKVIGLGGGSNGIYQVARMASVVDQVTGTIQHTSISLSCDTVWAYANRVADFLGDPELSQLRAAVDDVLPSGESIATTILDFANESLLLSMAVGGTYQHRADLAYVAGNVPNGAGSSWYNDHTGLDHLSTKLDDAEDPIRKGIDLLLELGTVNTGVSHASGSQAIPELSEEEYDTCTAGWCSDNSTTHVRALFYKRLRDALDLYQRNTRGRFEVLWRRLDGKLGSSCLAATDTDGDAVAETTTCTATVAGCEDICGWYADLDAIVTTTTTDMTAMRDMLVAHETYLTDADLIVYVNDLQAFADGIVTDLELRRTMVNGGVDFLGQRDGRWVPSIEHDPETDLDLKIGEIAGSSGAFGYEDFISSYLQRIAVTSQMATSDSTASANAYASLGSFCSDTNDVVKPNGCGISSAWGTTDALVAAVNTQLDRLCSRQVKIYYVEDEVIRFTTRTINLSDPQYADYVAQLGGMGFSDGCPQFTSPRFSSLDIPHVGTVAEQLANMKQQLLAVQSALSQLDLELTRIEVDSHAAAALGVVLYDAESSGVTLEKVMDSVMCGSAVVGAMATCGVFTAGTAGVGAATCVPAAAGAVAACATLADDDWIDSMSTTPEEVQLAFYQYSVALQNTASITTMATLLNNVVATSADYSNASLVYIGEQAEFSRALAVTNRTMATMYNDPANDPTAWFFQSQELESMKAQFYTFARDVRDLHRLVEYMTGHALGEGLILPLGTGNYCLPRLAEISVFKSYGNQLDSASEDLSGSACSQLAPADLNLVAMAGLLVRVSDAFNSVYGTRAETDAWLVGPATALGGIDRDLDGDIDLDDDAISRLRNPGEWALLADSGFYNPLGYVDIDADTDQRTCAAGRIDLDDVCHVFTDGATVEDDTCFDPKTLSEDDRIDLSYADRMVRGEHVETFACTRTQRPNGSYQYAVSVANGGSFTYASLGGTPSWLHAATGNETWQGGYVGGVTESYYLAQTRTTRAVLDRWIAEMIASGSAVGPTSLGHVPGTYVFYADTATTAFDPELDLLTEDPAASSTMAEQLVSMAFLCADDWACVDPTPHAVDLVLLGDAFQGDRYQLSTGRQEQVLYRMGSKVMDAPTEWSAQVLDPVTQSPAIDTLLSDPDVQAQFGRRPLHTSGLLLGVAGYAGPDGDVYYDDLTSAESPWALHDGNSLASRIRIKARFSYYGTSADVTSDYFDLTTLLPCLAADTTLISDPNVSCTQVSPY